MEKYGDILPNGAIVFILLFKTNKKNPPKHEALCILLTVQACADFFLLQCNSKAIVGFCSGAEDAEN